VFPGVGEPGGGQGWPCKREENVKKAQERKKERFFMAWGLNLPKEVKGIDHIEG
jgi:hypothetical protein